MHNQNNQCFIKVLQPGALLNHRSPSKNGENAFIYSNKNHSSENETLQLKHCVCMSSGSLRMQTLDDRAPMTDAIRIQTVLLQVNRPASSPLPDFPLMAEMMFNYFQLPQ
jgi:hypothetical protein